MDKKLNKSAKQKGPHVGPGKKVSSIYVDQEFHIKMKQRAAQLKLPLSKYLAYLAQKDINAGGDFTVTLSGD